jgi:hypothetical protein
MSSITELSVAAWRMISTNTAMSANYFWINSVRDLETTLTEIQIAKKSLSRAEQIIKRTIKKAEA